MRRPDQVRGSGNRHAAASRHEANFACIAYESAASTVAQSCHHASSKKYVLLKGTPVPQFGYSAALASKFPKTYFSHKTLIKYVN
jgi:hypothetical protein